MRKLRTFSTTARASCSKAVDVERDYRAAQSGALFRLQIASGRNLEFPRPRFWLRRSHAVGLTFKGGEDQCRLATINSAACRSGLHVSTCGGLLSLSPWNATGVIGRYGPLNQNLRR